MYGSPGITHSYALIRPRRPSRMAHERKAAQAFGAFENPADYGFGRARTILRNPRIYPVEGVVGGLADNHPHARRRAKRSRTSSSVRNVGFGSARRRLTSATCSSV